MPPLPCNGMGFLAHIFMIITNPDLLRPICDLVLPEEVEPIIKKLEIELEQSAKRGFPGVGLAAPQIGISKSIAIIRVGNIKLNLVNAKITKQYYEFEFDGEGCLSFPGLYKKTNRFKEIVVESNLVEPHTFIATDFLAVVIQHETEHLNQILLMDK